MHSTWHTICHLMIVQLSLCCVFCAGFAVCCILQVNTVWLWRTEGSMSENSEYITARGYVFVICISSGLNWCRLLHTYYWSVADGYCFLIILLIHRVYPKSHIPLRSHSQPTQHSMIKHSISTVEFYTRCPSCLEFTPSYNHQWSEHLCTSFQIQTWNIPLNMLL